MKVRNIAKSRPWSPRLIPYGKYVIVRPGVVSVMARWTGNVRMFSQTITLADEASK